MNRIPSTLAPAPDSLPQAFYSNLRRYFILELENAPPLGPSPCDLKHLAHTDSFPFLSSPRASCPHRKFLPIVTSTLRIYSRSILSFRCGPHFLQGAGREHQTEHTALKCI